MNAIIGTLSTHLQGAPFAALILDAWLKSIIVLALAGITCALWRQASAATRHLIWFLAVASLPFLPLLNLTRPAWQKPVWAISTTATAGNQISFALELAPKTIAPTTPNQPAAQELSTVPAATRKVSAHFSAHWIMWGWLAWLAGTIVVLIRMAAGQFQRLKFSGTARPVRSQDWTRLFNDACKTLHLRRTVTLLQSTNNVMPMTWGWWRPVVLLPAEAANWPDERRRVVLLHELAHVKRGDYPTQIVAQLVCALYWFNPLVWLAARRMCVEREGACDDLVLAGGCKASEYAGHLLEIAGNFRHVPQIAAIAMARCSQLEGRVAAIVDVSRNRRLRTTAAVAVLALISGIAICLGGSGNSTGNDAVKPDALRQQQIERLKAFSVEKEKQSETLAAAVGETISPEYQRFFDAAEQGDWQTVTNMFESFKEHHPQYSHPDQYTDVSLRTSYWGPALEICLAYDNVIGCVPAYTQMAVDGIIDSIPPGSIYFGGTDPGRGLPTAFSKSQVDADPFYTLTQNALADETYLEYLRKTYGDERALLGQLAEACRTNTALLEHIYGVSEETLKGKIEKLKSQISDSESRETANDLHPQTDTNQQEITKADLERTINLQRKNLNFYENLLLQGVAVRAKAILAQVRQNAGVQNGTGIQPLYIPTIEDAQKCFQDYVTDATERFHNHQLKPKEDVTISDGRTQVSGQVAVMEINGRLAKVIFDKNPGHEFYLEESFPLDWMYPNLEPHGLIMKINRQPLTEMTDAMVQRDRDYWQPRVTQMIGGWLARKTSVKKVIAFDEKVFLHHNLDGFSGDPEFVQNEYASKMFSKFRTAIAGLYAWRAENAASADEKQRMAEAADFAFRQALALCPVSTDTTTGYANFLKHQHRDADAKVVEGIARQFKSVTFNAAAPVKPTVLQIRLASDVSGSDTEPMQLVSRAGSAENQETLYVAKEVLLDNSSVQSASFQVDQNGNSEIELTLTDSGGRKLAEISRQHLHQKLAIVIDGKLWMAPVVQSEIAGGKVVITGRFSHEEGQALAAGINAAAAL